MRTIGDCVPEMPRWELVSCSWRLLRSAGRAAALAEVEPSIELALGARRRAEDMTRSVWVQLTSGVMSVDELWMDWTGFGKAFQAVVEGRKKLTQLRKEIAFCELNPSWISVVPIGSTKVFKHSNLISYSLVAIRPGFPPMIPRVIMTTVLSHVSASIQRTPLRLTDQKRCSETGSSGHPEHWDTHLCCQLGDPAPVTSWTLASTRSL